MEDINSVKSFYSCEPSFKSRVARFWGWYASVADRFYQVIEDGKCPSLADEVGEKVDELLGNFAWVFGPGAEGKGHSFTLSAEGDSHKQLLTQYWESCAPEINGWTFYPARQPGSVKNWVLKIGDDDFRPIEFWLTPELDEERKIIHLTVWHPLFEKLDKNAKYRVLFLALDETLGEYGVEQWLGRIDLGSGKLVGSIPILELPEYIAGLQSSKGWKKLPPGQSGVVYKIKETSGKYPRSDVYVGTSEHYTLIRDYMEASGRWANPVVRYGADFASAAFPISWLKQGEEIASRSKIEDALDAALRAEKSGRLLGGATGTDNAYIDLLLLDGARSREIANQVLREQGLPGDTTLRSFATMEADA